MTKEVKAIEITVLGEVQGVGYRRAVAKIARKLGLHGYVKNQSDESVRIFAQGENRQIKEFLGEIAIVRPPIKVESIRKKERKPTARHRSFAIKMGSLVNEFQEAMGTGEQQLSLLRLETGDNFKLLRSETQSNFDSLNSNLNEYRQDFKDYREQFSEFATRTDDNFNRLGDKYGEISNKMSQLLETLQKESAETRKELTRAVDNLARLVEQDIKLHESRSG